MAFWGWGRWKWCAPRALEGRKVFQAELPVLQRSRARVLREALPQSQVAKLVSKVSHINNERNIFLKRLENYFMKP